MSLGDAPPMYELSEAMTPSALVMASRQIAMIASATQPAIISSKTAWTPLKATTRPSRTTLPPHLVSPATYRWGAACWISRLGRLFRQDRSALASAISSYFSASGWSMVTRAWNSTSPVDGSSTIIVPACLLVTPSSRAAHTDGNTMLQARWQISRSIPVNILASLLTWANHPVFLLVSAHMAETQDEVLGNTRTPATKSHLVIDILSACQKTTSWRQKYLQQKADIYISIIVTKVNVTQQ